MMSDARDADGSSMPGRTTRPAMATLLPVVATRLVVAAVAKTALPDHAPAVPCHVVPAPKQNMTDMPNELSFGHVPAVSPGTVSVLYSHVLGALIVTFVR